MALLRGLMTEYGKRPENHQSEETFRTPQAERLRRMKPDRDSLTQSNSPMSTHVPWHCEVMFRAPSNVPT